MAATKYYDNVESFLVATSIIMSGNKYTHLAHCSCASNARYEDFQGVIIHVPLEN